MKHKVGDVVQIISKKGIEVLRIEDRKDWFTNEMFTYCGRIVKITHVNDGSYDIDEDNGDYVWQDWMFEPAKIYGGFGITKPQENDEVDSNITSFEGITSEMLETYTKKNSDYGGSFDKSMNEFGLISAVIRMSDKIERLKSLVKQDAKVKEESIEDTLYDLASYAVMTLINLKKNNYG